VNVAVTLWELDDREKFAVALLGLAVVIATYIIITWNDR
jgi:hypothetical protein